MEYCRRVNEINIALQNSMVVNDNHLIDICPATFVLIYVEHMRCGHGVQMEVSFLGKVTTVFDFKGINLLKIWSHHFDCIVLVYIFHNTSIKLCIF